MGHWKLWCVLITLSGIAGAQTQTVSAVSNTFTFPPITAIKAHGNKVNGLSFFTCSSHPSRSTGVQFAWNFSTQSQVKNGSIVIYSPLGRTIAKIPVSATTGMVVWNDKREHGTGVYIAKISCGAAGSRNLKFLLSR
jgi:hypothetical protein